MVEKEFSLAKFGKRLGTRLEGEKAHTEIFSELEKLPEGGVLILDLEGVEVLSGSFADEAIGKVLERLRKGELPGRYLILRTGNLEVLEDLEAKLIARRLGVLVEHKTEKGWKVIGCLPQHLFRFFQYVLAHPGVTSKDAAQDLGVSLKTASLCLKRLSELRLLRAEREIRPQGGFQYRFLPLV